MQRLLGFVALENTIEDLTSSNYHPSKLKLRVVTIPAIKDKTKQRLKNLARELISNLSYSNFTKFKQEDRNVIISAIYETEILNTEILCMGPIKEHATGLNNYFIQRQMSITSDFLRKDFIESGEKNIAK